MQKALYARKETKINRILHGALSTQQLWPDVENMPAIVGFHAAAKLALEQIEHNNEYIKRLRDRLFKGILDNVSNILVNGPLGDKRVIDNVNISFLYVEGEALTIELSIRGVYVSSGSAYTSRVLEPSHVLLAIGRKHEEVHGSILFKLSRYHKVEDIDYAIENIVEAVDRLRKLYPS